MRHLMSLLIALLPTLASFSDEPKPKIVLEDAPRTVEDVMKGLASQTKDLDAKMAELEAKHRAAVKKAEAKAIVTLKDIAKFEVGNGQLAKGIAAWTEVVKIDPEDKEAVTFFKSIGRTDVVEKAKTKGMTLQEYTKLERVEFQRDDGAILRKRPNGVWYEFDTDGKRTHVHREIARSFTNIRVQHPAGSVMDIQADRIYIHSADGDMSDGWKVNEGKWLK